MREEITNSEERLNTPALGTLLCDTEFEILLREYVQDTQCALVQY